MAEHRFTIDRVMADAHQGVLQPPRERNSFQLEESPEPVALVDLNPRYTGLVFPGSEPENLDLTTFLMDSTIPEEVRQRVNLAVEMSHRENLKKVKALDHKVRGLYGCQPG